MDHSPRHISLTNLIDPHTPRNDPASIPTALVTPRSSSAHSSNRSSPRDQFSGSSSSPRDQFSSGSSPRDQIGGRSSSPRDQFSGRSSSPRDQFNGSSGQLITPHDQSIDRSKPNAVVMPFVLIFVEDTAKQPTMMSLTLDQMMIQDEFNKLIGNLRLRFDSTTKTALINYCAKLERLFPQHNALLERLYRMVLRIEAEITGHFLFDSGLLYTWVHYCQYCNEQWLISLCDVGTNFNINVPLTHIYNCAYYIQPTRKLWAASAIYGRIEREPAAISLLAAMFAAGACCKVPPSIGAKIFAEHKKHARLVRFYVCGAIWKRAARERNITENIIERVMDML